MNKIDEFLTSVAIVDTETTGIDTSTSEIVELGIARYNPDTRSWVSTQQLFGSTEPIPFEASSVNHISRKMIEGLPVAVEPDSIVLISEMLDFENTKYFVAHNGKYDQSILTSTYTRAFNDESISDIIPKFEDWLCTWRIARALFGVTFKKGNFSHREFSLAYLRYSMDLDLSDDHPAHRAGADAITCGRLLEKLLEEGIRQNRIDINKDIGNQMVSLCRSTPKIECWPLGKEHLGKKIEELTTKYLLWAIDNMAELNPESNKYDEDLTRIVINMLDDRDRNRIVVV